MPRTLTSARINHMKKLATRLGKDFPGEAHSRLLDVVARLEGFPDWRAATLAVTDPNLLGSDPEDQIPPGPSEDRAYLDAVAAGLRDAYLRTGREALPIGHAVDDPRTLRFVELGRTPHFAIIGRTGCGKTLAAQSWLSLLARSFPDTRFLVADGKGEADWNSFVAATGARPVAKIGSGGDLLGGFTALLDEAWRSLRERRELFDKARHAGTPVSVLSDYRRKVGPLPAVFVVIDELSSFVMEMDFEASYREDGTAANKLTRLVREGGSYGIHVLLLSQRYQLTDFPMALRGSLSRIIFTLDARDAQFLETPMATELPPGRHITTPTGRETLLCEVPHLTAPRRFFRRVVGNQP